MLREGRDERAERVADEQRALSQFAMLREAIGEAKQRTVRDRCDQLIADIQAGKPDESMFAPGGQQSVTQLQPQVSQMGTVKSITFQAVGPAGPDIYRVEAEKGSWVFRILMTAEGKVELAMAQPTQGQ